jgi:hypothetical protein
MKKLIYLLLLFPILVSFQCEDDLDTGFETSYVIQNDLNIALYFLNDGNAFVEIPSAGAVTIGSVLNPETSPITPSEAAVFEQIRLYIQEGEDFTLVYTQDPLDDPQWTFDEPEVNRYEYTLVITADKLD